MTDFPQFKYQLGDTKMNSEPKEKIITGLKLSEAIKYCEENEGALIRYNGATDFYKFDFYDYWELNTTYDVKLPPPKSVSVTYDDFEKAWEEAHDATNPGSPFQIMRKRLGL